MAGFHLGKDVYKLRTSRREQQEDGLTEKKFRWDKVKLDKRRRERCIERKQGVTVLLLLLMKCGLCVWDWRPQVRTDIMTSFLFSFAQTLSSTPIYSSSPLSVSKSLALLSFFYFSFLCVAKPEVTPSSKQTETHKARHATVCVDEKCVWGCFSHA